MGYQQFGFRKLLQNLRQGLGWDVIRLRNVFGTARALRPELRQMFERDQPVIGFLRKLQHLENLGRYPTF
jgi:hypothetical protein